MEKLYAVNKNDLSVQAKYLELLSDNDFSKARELAKELQQKQMPNFGAVEDEDIVQKLLDEGMPQKRKEKKSKDMDQMETEFGACILIPSKRKKRVRYPKNFNPEMPGDMPDPERWLPKWQ